ncbi:branched-chain amino acid transport system ATP-binding protein [Mesorhizobium albiziae]|uniref:Branched-chain amino acid transport system ATP-binding protein n=1 Tax=Neomesorhizobium albiziae TaxID=335020 RepID=A0A1I4EV45_9HYPH|nr:ABC transporter ATP-binding protein [Mesorhizobium albiziae]GLS32675.1 ABC transporter ATP-binding protein [Mesorhizobium albiziae]SFL09169.1 branched-chain amino acid transport system ATP-binding protein [Mesorhizobium albiziae]
MKPLLHVEDLNAFYGDLQALFGVDFSVGEGECIAVIGSNGAGKSTLLRSVTGLHRGRSAKRLSLAGAEISQRAASEIVAMGMTLVPEGRRLFSSLTVEENLTIGRSAGRAGYWNLSRIYELFPTLLELGGRPVTKLSGGQQQMVAMGRALMTNPNLLLCDEISLGLAPVVVKGIYDNFARVRGQGTAVIIVEQDIGRALSVADRIICLRKGAVMLSGAPASFTRNQIAEAYFGVEGE